MLSPVVPSFHDHVNIRKNIIFLKWISRIFYGCKFCALQLKGGDIWKVARKRRSWTLFNFYLILFTSVGKETCDIVMLSPRS